MKNFSRPGRLLYLSIISFVFIVSVCLTFKKEIQQIVILPRKVSNVSPLPVLADSASFPILSAQGVIVIDLDSFVTLYEKNPDATLLPASTTKIMTALVAMDYYPKDMVIEVGKIKVDGQKMNLVDGEKITVNDLLYGLLVYSANDAAEVLAENYPGGRQLFITAMNLKAQELSMLNTKFQNPSGLDAEGHYSTARDMTRLAEYSMRNEYFAQIVGTREKTVYSLDKKIIHRLKNINELLGVVPGVKGVKTGWTENARENLITYIERDGHKILIAILGSQDRFGETKELINWTFENYTWKDANFNPNK